MIERYKDFCANLTSVFMEVYRVKPDPLIAEEFKHFLDIYTKQYGEEVYDIYKEVVEVMTNFVVEMSNNV